MRDELLANRTASGQIEQKHGRRSVANFVRLARWSLRKLELPIRPTDLVLDVGSGASPHPRADVLLERHVSGQHRHGAVAVVDRPTVFADACRMPFRDKTFDYVIAFHVLEHIPRPELFLEELMRVAKAGYIETPNVIFEHLVPYDIHCLEVMNLGDRLFIRKKAAPVSDPFIGKLNIVSRSARWNDFFYGNPEYFHVRYHWTDRIEFDIANPEESCSWYMRHATQFDRTDEPSSKIGGKGLRGVATRAVRKFYALRRPPADLPSLLVCPDCRSAPTDEGETFHCVRCRKRYAGRPWPVFVEPVDDAMTNNMDSMT